MCVCVLTCFALHFHGLFQVDWKRHKWKFQNCMISFILQTHYTTEQRIHTNLHNLVPNSWWWYWYMYECLNIENFLVRFEFEIACGCRWLCLFGTFNIIIQHIFTYALLKYPIKFPLLLATEYPTSEHTLYPIRTYVWNEENTLIDIIWFHTWSVKICWMLNHINHIMNCFIRELTISLSSLTLFTYFHSIW